MPSLVFYDDLMARSVSDVIMLAVYLENLIQFISSVGNIS
jgi:hypothetical protein